MTSHEYRFPDVGEGTAEGELLTWYVTEGDQVAEDQVIAEVETDKAVVDIPAPVDGTVVERRYEESEVVPVGEVFVVFEVKDATGEGGDTTGTGSDVAATGNGATGATGDAAVTAAGTASDEGANGAGEPTDLGEASVQAVPDGRTFASPVVRRLAREHGVSLDTVTGTGAGGRVTAGDVRAAGQSNRQPTKPEGEPPAPSTESGGPPTTTDSGDNVSDVDTGPTPGAGGPPRTPAERERTLAQPTTRRVAHELGVDIDAVPAVEERDGEALVTAEAVRTFAESGTRTEPSSPDAGLEAEVRATPPPAPDSEMEAEAGAASSPPTGAVGVEERIPYRGVRRTIGQQMERSKFNIPHVTTVDEVDMTELVEIREQLAPAAADRDVNLTYLAFVIKAIGTALQEFPYLNATLDAEAEEIVLQNEYNVGIATESDDGLRVPVVDGVNGRGLLNIAEAANRVTQRARDGTITREEMQGGTFTISNIGPYGGEHGTPIINYPEAGIIAMGRVKQKPRVINDEVVPRHVVNLSLSFDHRIVDGAMAAQFLNRVKEQLESPELFLL